MPRSEGKLVLREAKRVAADPYRRLFLKRGLSLGALAMLSGCNLSDGHAVETMLARISRWNDSVQGWLFNPKNLAPEYTVADITNPFPFNAYYTQSEIRPAPADYTLKVGGMVSDKRPVTLQSLAAMPQTGQITRHVCVEGWSAIGQWGGVRFSDVLHRIGADLTAKYVTVRCFDDYYTTIDMPTALHPQTLLTTSYAGETLPAKYGYPLKLRMPTKLGFKNPKYIAEIFVTNTDAGGYWEDQGYNWYSGL